MKATIETINRTVLIAALLLFSVNAFSNDTIPEFQLTHFEDGTLITDETLRGKVLYIDFWASWCAPCRKTFPFMNELNKQYGEQDFKVIAINMDEKREDANDFLARYHAEFDIYTNNGNTLAEALNLPGLPTAYIVDKQGVIRAKHTGFRKSTKQKTLKQIQYLMEQ